MRKKDEIRMQRKHCIELENMLAKKRKSFEDQLEQFEIERVQLLAAQSWLRFLKGQVKKGQVS